MIRISDVIFSLAGLILLFPVFLLVSVWIALDSNGPVIYRQKRVGKGNKDFVLYKFRTMGLNAEKRGMITVGSRDPRVTRSGAFLRKYKIDELPQLWNVLTGEMSLVGP
ncbi:MAG TPA: sugar transferase, partial [Bacteroidia bacterium]|nr:sugar transferase [Bacteroidia bacterium]